MGDYVAGPPILELQVKNADASTLKCCPALCKLQSVYSVGNQLTRPACTPVNGWLSCPQMQISVPLHSISMRFKSHHLLEMLKSNKVTRVNILATRDFA